MVVQDVTVRQVTMEGSFLSTSLVLLSVLTGTSNLLVHQFKVQCFNEVCQGSVLLLVLFIMYISE